MRAVLFVGVLAVGLLVTGAFVGVAMQQSEVDRQARTYRQQIAAEEAKHAQLEAHIAERNTDQYVVDRARALGYVRPGEGLIAIDRGPSGVPVVRVNASDGGRFARWWAVFFGGR